MQKLLFIISVLFLASCGPELPEEVAIEYAKLPQELDFNIHVKPILSDKCFSCHGPDKAKQKADLRLDEAEGAYSELPESPGKFAIKPGNLNKSVAFHRVISDDPEYRMPTPESNLSLTAKEKAIIVKWIEDGAAYKTHWAFLKPESIDPPKVKKTDWIQNPIDQFIARKLEAESLSPSVEAEKEILYRRVSFDLTGLPPTEAEMNAYLTDDSENAYEKQVDRLLASPHYGEKMAVDWMDLARYSDTHGYQVDRYRDVSPWRDWVIKSFNENMRYDQFIEWQLAGDLLPNATREQILATTFNRLHPQNLEGGIVDEEFRVEYVADRASVVGQGFMGLSVACARCHDHKFDPFSQKNFYELYGFFNHVNETGQIPWEMAMPVPTLLLPEKEEEEIVAFLEGVVKEKSDAFESHKREEEKQAQIWMEANSYQSIPEGIPNRGLVANYTLDNHLKNKMNTRQIGKMDREFSANEKPVYTEGKERQGLAMDGDAWLDLGKVGIFQRKDAFSIGIWVNVPKALEEGVFFHKCKATRLHSYRGYHLYLKDNKLELMLAHTWPDNAIVKRTVAEIPKDEWAHLMMTYDGSSKASGVKVYLNGAEMQTETEIDNLYKDIVFFDYEDVIYRNPIEPGLQIGARWRGVGIKDATVDDVLVYDRALSEMEILGIANPESFNSIISTSYEGLTQNHKSLLSTYFLANKSSVLKGAEQALIEARGNLFKNLEQIKEIMVMKEMDEPRKTYVLERGLYDAYGEEVFPNVPENILPWRDEYPKNRLGLAKWLTDPEHPLTARVTVNRYWQNYFGRGIVKTTEDFGNQGELPSHPELLDWLARGFINSNWDVKALQKRIVMSATYRQSSQTPKELLEKDPDNILLARGPSVRLSSEMMRDNALVASGLLNGKIGGESVKPYQPKGLWKMNGGTYVQDSGDKLYRRSLYTLWKRTVPNPTLATFDQPERSECTVRRQKTNTPLQALVLLNDPTYIEAAKVIGENITKEGATKESIAKAYQKITGRKAEENILNTLVQLQASEYEHFKDDPAKASGWLDAGEYEIDASLDVHMIAANAIVASVIINSDASITKR